MFDTYTICNKTNCTEVMILHCYSNLAMPCGWKSVYQNSIWLQLFWTLKKAFKSNRKTQFMLHMLGLSECRRHYKSKCFLTLPHTELSLCWALQCFIVVQPREIKNCVFFLFSCQIILCFVRIMGSL